MNLKMSARTFSKFDGKQKLIISAFIVLSVITFACQALLFWGSWTNLGFSILVGTSFTLIGALCGVLSAPYTKDEEQKLEQVASVVAGVFSGYLVAKVIDPVTTTLIADEEIFVNPQRAANVFVALIGFVGGFLGTYSSRVYFGLAPGVSEAQEKDDKGSESPD